MDVCCCSAACDGRRRRQVYNKRSEDHLQMTFFTTLELILYQGVGVFAPSRYAMAAAMPPARLLALLCSKAQFLVIFT